MVRGAPARRGPPAGWPPWPGRARPSDAAPPTTHLPPARRRLAPIFSGRGGVFICPLGWYPLVAPSNRAGAPVWGAPRLAGLGRRPSSQPPLPRATRHPPEAASLRCFRGGAAFLFALEGGTCERRRKNRSAGRAGAAPFSSGVRKGLARPALGRAPRPPDGLTEPPQPRRTRSPRPARPSPKCFAGVWVSAVIFILESDGSGSMHNVPLKTPLSTAPHTTTRTQHKVDTPLFTTPPPPPMPPLPPPAKTGRIGAGPAAGGRGGCWAGGARWPGSPLAPHSFSPFPRPSPPETTARCAPNTGLNS